MKYSIPSHIRKIMDLLHTNNFKPYLVGGCVRDFIMGIIPHDYDITVCASPEEIQSLFENEGYRAEIKSTQFGTVNVFTDKEPVEITPYRIEGEYTDSRHPGYVKFVNDIKKDLSRRDFTVNAIAMDANGVILDIFGGTEDIHNGILRCIGTPDIRFEEDALRILRAIRFASRLVFEIETETLNAMDKCKYGLKKIPPERILDELRGTICHPFSFTILNKCESVMKCMITGFSSDAFLKEEYGDFALKFFSCIHHNTFTDVMNICDSLRLRKNETAKIRELYILYNEVLTRNGRRIILDDKLKEALCDYPSEYIRDLFVFSDSDTESLNNFLNCGVYTARQLAFSGSDIISCGLFDKSKTSILLKNALKAVAVGKIKNDREDILRYLTEYCGIISE